MVGKSGFHVQGVIFHKQLNFVERPQPRSESLHPRNEVAAAQACVYFNWYVVQSLVQCCSGGWLKHNLFQSIGDPANLLLTLVFIL